MKLSFHKGIRIIWRLFCRWNRAQCMLGFWVKCCHAFFSVPRPSWEAVLYGQGLGLLGCPNALTESNSWHSDHVETEESFYPHPSPISVSASPRGVGTYGSMGAGGKQSPLIFDRISIFIWFESKDFPRSLLNFEPWPHQILRPSGVSQSPSYAT